MPTTKPPVPHSSRTLTEWLSTMTITATAMTPKMMAWERKRFTSVPVLVSSSAGTVLEFKPSFSKGPSIAGIKDQVPWRAWRAWRASRIVHHRWGRRTAPSIQLPRYPRVAPDRRARERVSAVDLRSDVFGQRVDYRCSGTSQLRTGRRAADMPHLTIFLPDTRHSWHGLKGFGEHQTHL